MTATDPLPVYIDDSEKLARAVFHPYHIHKGKLKSAVFKAPALSNQVSVNRLRGISIDICKQKAKEMANGQKQYKGFAIISAEAVRRQGSEVIDSRDPPMYLGHADIIHDVVLEKGVPAPAEFNQRLNKMAKAAVYLEDPLPVQTRWQGEVPETS